MIENILSGTATKKNLPKCLPYCDIIKKQDIFKLQCKKCTKVERPLHLTGLTKLKEHIEEDHKDKEIKQNEQLLWKHFIIQQNNMAKCKECSELFQLGLLTKIMTLHVQKCQGVDLSSFISKFIIINCVYI